jgi:hypothetical protein
MGSLNSKLSIRGTDFKLRYRCLCFRFDLLCFDWKIVEIVNWWSFSDWQIISNFVYRWLISCHFLLGRRHYKKRNGDRPLGHFSFSYPAFTCSLAAVCIVRRNMIIRLFKTWTSILVVSTSNFLCKKLIQHHHWIVLICVNKFTRTTFLTSS